MRQWLLAAALLAATACVTVAGASVPTVPSPSAPKAPASGSGALHRKKAVRKAPVTKKDPRALRDAVDSGNVSSLSDLFYKKGYSVYDVVDDERNMPLHRVAELCNLPLQTRLELIKYFIDLGGNLRAENKWGDTPLVIAKAKCGGPPAVLAMLTPSSPAEQADQRARGAQWWQRGNDAMNSGSVQQGLAAYLEAEKADPTNPVYYNAVAMAYERLGNWEAAVRELQVAVGLGHQIGISQSSLDYAMQQLREQQTPQGKAKALRQQADQLRTSGAYRQAIQVYDQARGLDPTNAATLNGEGVAYYQLGDYATAERAFQMALQLAPSDPVIRTNLQNAQQAIAAAEQRRQQAALQQQQYEQRQRQYAYEQAQRAKRNEFFNTVTQGLALGAQIAEANRPAPRPAPPPSYSPPPSYAAPQTRQIAQSSPRPSPVPQSTSPTRTAVGGVTGNCITIQPPPPGGGSFWRVYNNCPVRVIGSFCYDGSTTFRCNVKGGGGGFGPIRPGGYEAISSPGQGQVMTHWAACNYDDWNAGLCEIGVPGR